METASIIIGTYGDVDYWGRLAESAAASARAQTVPAEVHVCHGETLQQARNQGAADSIGDWLIFLDADDTLDPGYVEGILAGDGDLRQPKTLGVYPDGHEDPEPVFIPRKTSFSQGNWLVVGTGVRRETFEAAGGWGDEDLYEDWALWWRCWLAGAEIGTAPGAIYRVGVNLTGASRNLPHPSVQMRWFREISARYMSITKERRP